MSDFSSQVRFYSFFPIMNPAIVETTPVAAIKKGITTANVTVSTLGICVISTTQIPSIISTVNDPNNAANFHAGIIYSYITRDARIIVITTKTKNIATSNTFVKTDCRDFNSNSDLSRFSRFTVVTV